VGDRDAGQRGGGDRAGHARHDQHRHAGRGAGQGLLAAAAEDVRIAALEPDHELPHERPLDQDPVDLLLGLGRAVGDLGSVHELDIRPQVAQQQAGYQPVGDHHVGGGQQAATLHRDQLGVARAGAHQGHPLVLGRGDRPIRPPRHHP
jgi:hypothetical protein